MLVQLIARAVENMQFVRVPREHRVATSFYKEASQGKERASCALRVSIPIVEVA